jgi:cold shock protein
MQGTVKFFKVDNGYGFITGEDGTDYFVHKSGLEDGVNIRENDVVTFEVEQGDKGEKATHVKKA